MIYIYLDRVVKRISSRLITPNLFVAGFVFVLQDTRRMRSFGFGTNRAPGSLQSYRRSVRVKTGIRLRAELSEWYSFLRGEVRAQKSVPTASAAAVISLSRGGGTTGLPVYIYIYILYTTTIIYIYISIFGTLI